jgi:two-component system nitrate/nitrite response regulator NarL
MASLPNLDLRIKVLVADAVAMSCRLLADALQRSKRYQAVAAVTRKEIFEALDSVPFQVLLISHTFAGEVPDGCGLVREIQDRHPELNIVVLLDALERERVLQAFRAGARGVFCRSDSFQTLCKCIVCVSDGQVWASSAELLFVLDALVAPAPIETRNLPGARPLSKREEEIARLVAEGLSNRQISQRLELSEHTIKNYLFRVFEKLGVGTRVELALYALKRGQVRKPLPQAIKAALEKPGPGLVRKHSPS